MKHLSPFKEQIPINLSETFSMATTPAELQENAATTPTKAIDIHIDGRDDKIKSPPRHPRWTRKETLILIEGKKAAENRGRKGRRSSSEFGSDQHEPKWDSVSSYCKQHGVNRGPVQCRKRYSNMVGDFKRIKSWESQIKIEGDSFWMMRNDLRKDNKLPGSFDKEVFDVLDGKEVNKSEYQLALVTVSSDGKDGNGVEEEEEEGGDEEEAEVVFDSGRQAATEDGIFSDLDKDEAGMSPEKRKVATGSPTKTIPAPTPISEKRFQPFHQAYSDQGAQKEKQSGSPFVKECMQQEGCKRRRVLSDRYEEVNLEDRLIKVLEKNGNMLNAQIETQNMNSKLDRDQRKDQNDSLVAALHKMTDALTKIADKL